MFVGATVPYPRQDEIDDDEDGVGFALRMATLNGITFNELARRLASPGHLYLPASSSGAIAFMFGCAPMRLHSAFVTRYFRGEAYGARFVGHDFLRPYHLRQTRPQLCPACIRQHVRALAAWSVCLVTACPTHRLRLLDQCICGRPVSWRRPSIDICECGRLLTDIDQPVQGGDPRELAVSSQIMYLLGPAHFRLHSLDGALGAFDGLSVDTFVRLLWIFGTVDTNACPRGSRAANQLLPTNEAAALCCRAYDRLARVTESKKQATGVAVHHVALDALRLDCRSLADVQLVESLCSRLIGKRVYGRNRSPRGNEQQLLLFDEQDE